MTPETFRAGIEMLWGRRAQARAAEHWDIADRSIRRFVSGEQRVPEAIARDLMQMIGMRPPPGTDADADADTETRDAACAETIEPALTEIRNRCLAVGWQPTEIAVAMVSLALSEIVVHAGPAAAAALLDEAKAALATRFEPRS